jgi:nucleoside-diphosphate-sugar epimerase
MIKVLFIGGTGNISTSVSRLCVEKGYSLTLLSRGMSDRTIPGAETIQADIRDSEAVKAALGNRKWDVVADWIAFHPAEVQRDIDLFRGKTGQYIFISSASAYQKPASNYVIRESTPLSNPYWEYSRNKIAGEELLLKALREEGFPGTIVRPSHTYDTIIPLAVGGGSEYTTVERIKNGLPVVSHGDGTSLWTVTHSEDFAKGFVGLLGNPRAIGQAFHITSDEALTWDQILCTIGAAVGREPQIVHMPSDVLCQLDPKYTGELLGDKSWSVVFDNSKIKSLVPSFICTVPFHIGIRRTLAWFQADPKRMKVNPETTAFIEKTVALVKIFQGGATIEE